MISTMCEISGSFVYRRFMEEAWPLVYAFMIKQNSLSAGVGLAYMHSAAYRFQKVVLQR